MIKMIAAAAALALGLSACAPTQIGGIPSVSTPTEGLSLLDTYTTICQNEPTIYLGFVTFASASGKISQKTQQRVREAHIVVTEACRTPPTDLQSTVTLMLRAYASVQASRTELVALREGMSVEISRLPAPARRALERGEYVRITR